MSSQISNNPSSSVDNDSFQNKLSGVVIHTMPKNTNKAALDKANIKEDKESQVFLETPNNLTQQEPVGKTTSFLQKKNFYYIIAALFLIFLIGAFLVYFFVLKPVKPQPPITPIEEPPVEPPISPVEPPIQPQPDLIQKIQNIYNDQGEIEESIVLSLAKDSSIDFSQISLVEYKTEDENIKKYLEPILSHSYYLDLKEQAINRPSVLTITYSYSMLVKKDLIADDLKIGFLKIISSPAGANKWNIYQDVQIDEKLNSISLALPKIETGVFAVVKTDINDFIPQTPLANPPNPYGILPASIDSDSDGLTDTEEAIFETDPKLVDTDKDGFTDYKEVLNLYSPKNPGKSVLMNDGTVALYQNPNFKYYLLYPKEWKVNNLEQNNLEVIFSSTANSAKGTTSGEFIVVSVKENPGKLALADWYLLTSPSSKMEDIKDYFFPGFRAISVLNELTIYFILPKDNSLIYVLNYDAGIQTELNYKNIFLLFQKTFTFNADNLNPQFGQETNPPDTGTDNPLQTEMKKIFSLETIDKCVRDNSSFLQSSGVYGDVALQAKDYIVQYKCYPKTDEIVLLHLDIKTVENIVDINTLATIEYGNSLLYIKDKVAYLDYKQIDGFFIAGGNLIYINSQFAQITKSAIDAYQSQYSAQDLPIKIKERDVFSVPQARDEKRIKDLNLIKEKLAFFSENQQFPESLAVLGDELPTDLTLTGDAKPYDYQPNEDNKNFQIKFILEVGFAEYKTGGHILTAEGIQ